MERERFSGIKPKALQDSYSFMNNFEQALHGRATHERPIEKKELVGFFQTYELK